VAGPSAWDVPLETPTADRVDVFMFELEPVRAGERADRVFREALAQTLRLPSDAVELADDGPGGVVAIPVTGSLDLRFSVARTHDFATVAVALGREVAIAIEPTHGYAADHEALTREASDELRATLARLGPRGRADALARCAAADRLRALVPGARTRGPADCNDLLTAAASPLGRPLRVGQDGVEWGLRSFTAGACHAGAVLAEGCDWKLRAARCPRIAEAASDGVSVWMDGGGI
jgi:hypothetical protein